MFTTIPIKSELLGVDWKMQFQKASGGEGYINVRNGGNEVLTGC